MKSLAFAGRAVVDEVLGLDTGRLERLAARFSKPVLMGDVLMTEGWEVDEQEGIKCYGFRGTNQVGVEVISNGIARVSS